MMNLAPLYYQRAVQLIDRDWFVAWNPRKKRWQIRMWTAPHSEKDIRLFETYAPKSIAIMTVCYEDEETQKDIGYKPLDDRTLHALRVARRNADNPEAVMRDIDEWNEKLEESWNKEIEYMCRDAVKNTWKHFHEPMIDLGAKNAR
jgi:hypothetical protein